MKKTTISIGIPAYNEEYNIERLLHYLLEQIIDNAILKEIVVVSDGSTDQTVKKARQVKDKRIRIIERTVRQGMNATENELLSVITGDILIFINADVLPCDDRLLHTLVTPLLNNPSVGLVGGNTIAAAMPKSFVDWALSAGHELKQNLYARINEGNTVYLCHGRIRAIRKAVYKTLRFPLHVPEDAYSYFYTLKHGYTFTFCREARVFFRSPISLSEHAQQSNRFVVGKKTLLPFFGSKAIEQSYAIPFLTIVRSVLWSFSIHPVSTTTYVIISIIVRLFYKSQVQNTQVWDVATSSKSVI